jgi:hypothetical protein
MPSEPTASSGNSPGNTSETTPHLTRAQWIFVRIVVYLLGLTGIAFGTMRIVYVNGDERFGIETFALFAAGGLALLFPFIRRLKYGDLEIEFEQFKDTLVLNTKDLWGSVGWLKDKLETRDVSLSPSPFISASITATAETKTAKVKTNSDAIAETATGLLQAARRKRPGPDPDDPWKGVFGGEAQNRQGTRKLWATVVEIPDRKGWFQITLYVDSIGAAAPLEGTVQFFLHPSFPNDRPKLLASSGRAIYKVPPSWGAFTVGVLADDGNTELELDLALDSSFPSLFRSR